MSISWLYGLLFVCAEIVDTEIIFLKGDLCPGLPVLIPKERWKMSGPSSGPQDLKATFTERRTGMIFPMADGT